MIYEPKAAILNVDDNDGGRHLLSQILRREGFEVIEAATGGDALRLARENPDLVILDVHLPDINGFEVCRRIKADPATSLIPVLHLSGIHRDDQSKVRGLESGADCYLTQPVEPSVLIACVKALLRIRQMQGKLLAAAQEWRTTFDTIGDAVSLLDVEGRVQRCNKTMANLLEKPFGEIIGRTCWELVHGTSGPIEGCPFLRMLETRHRESVVLSLSDRWFNAAVDPLLDGDGNIVGAVHIMTDITERVQAEKALRRAHDELEIRVQERTVELAAANEQLRKETTERKRAEEQTQASLREKEALLREVHHRVKNNLQVISSLLDLTSLRALDQQAIDLLTDARARIHTMALIHLQLYQSERFDQIDMENHVQELVNYLSQAFATKSSRITPVVEPSDVYLSITQAIPCALVLNEVISNAFKHAFEEGQKGIIEVSIRREANDTILLRVKDDGIGLPEGIDIDTTNSLGLKLIRNLVQEQLRGRLQVKRDKGTEIAIEFPIVKEEVEHA